MSKKSTKKSALKRKLNRKSLLIILALFSVLVSFLLVVYYYRTYAATPGPTKCSKVEATKIAKPFSKKMQHCDDGGCRQVTINVPKGLYYVPTTGALYSSVPSKVWHPLSSDVSKSRVSSLETINAINTAASNFCASSHCYYKFSVGDAYAKGGHTTHNTGYYADIYAPNEGSPLFEYATTFSNGKASIKKNASYDKEITKTLAKDFIKTGRITQILYSDKAFVKSVNDWAKENKYPQVMSYAQYHTDHFHIKFKSGSYCNL